MIFYISGDFFNTLNPWWRVIQHIRQSTSRGPTIIFVFLMFLLPPAPPSPSPLYTLSSGHNVHIQDFVGGEKSPRLDETFCTPGRK